MMPKIFPSSHPRGKMGGCQGSLELVWNHVWMDEKIATFSLPIWPHFFHFYPSFVSSLINNLTPFLLAFSRTSQLCSFQDKNLKNESRSQQLKDNSSEGVYNLSSIIESYACFSQF